MRALICLVTVGLVAAAIGFSAADEKVKDDSSKKSASKAGSTNAPKSAEGNKSARDGSNTNPAPAQNAAGKEDSGDQADGQYAEEEAAILKAGISYVTAFDDHDAKRVAAHFAPEAEFVDDEGQVFRGRNEIEDSLTKVFKERPKVSLALEVDSLRVLSPMLAIEEGTSTCTSEGALAPHVTRYTAVHTKTDGQWLVASVREHGLHGMSGGRLHNLHLRQLDWLVGNWVDEHEDSVVRFNCQMTESGNYLIRDFDVTVAGQKVLSGSQRTGWDPLSGKLRAWTFDSDGGYFEGVWHRNGDDWVLTSRGITSDGQSAAGTAVFTPVDGSTIKWQAVDREIDGVRIDDSEVFTLARSGPQPQKSEEAASK
jgi:uncharacterized protein (TIGR02246 family)